MDYVDTSRNQVVLKMIPRIDYTRVRGEKRGEGDRVAKKKRRPPAKFFDPELIRWVVLKTKGRGQEQRRMGAGYFTTLTQQYFPLTHDFNPVRWLSVYQVS